MKSVPIARFLVNHKRETNIQQSDLINTTLTSGVFEAASSHHRFNKNASQLRSVFKSIFDGNSASALKSRYFSEMPPVAVTTGAERISSDGTMPYRSLIKNTPINV